ncbi:MarR family winged helix-turn-helix transcriptional regulator [Gordonia sp. CPCC 205333]|uniref:MarR family winged helix-turn-helix transcriptional regulator n=1 Tax=Gordonia sp. CPCC 205333 TaxID=3140790 RepID=UPI003AF3D2B5
MQSSVSSSDDPVGATCAVLEQFFERITCSAKAATMDTMVATELTFSQMRSVFILGSHGLPMSVNELAGELGLSLAAAGRGIDKLVGLGIVDRREDAADRRIKRISLTDKGQDIVDAQLSIKEDLLRDFVSRLPAELRDDLQSTLSSIVNGDNDYFPTSIPQKAHA